MNCEYVTKNLDRLVERSLSFDAASTCQAHIRSCGDCRELVLGAEALATLREKNAGPAPAGLFDRLVDEAAGDAARRAGNGKFILGGLSGAAVTAAAFIIALGLGWAGNPGDERQAGPPAEFVVGVAERRLMDLAIETDRRLDDATISIDLYGPIELDGYGPERHIAWRTDLDAGVNRLSLPVVAVDDAGGRMVVRLSHPNSEQVFVVRLRAES
jgi:hypothetical protein